MTIETMVNIALGVGLVLVFLTQVLMVFGFRWWNWANDRETTPYNGMIGFLVKLFLNGVSAPGSTMEFMNTKTGEVYDYGDPELYVIGFPYLFVGIVWLVLFCFLRSPPMTLIGLGFIGVSFLVRFFVRLKREVTAHKADKEAHK